MQRSNIRTKHRAARFQPALGVERVGVVNGKSEIEGREKDVRGTRPETSISSAFVVPPESRQLKGKANNDTESVHSSYQSLVHPYPPMQ